MTIKPIESMVIEVTTDCPLRCPFCYCLPETSKHLPLNEVLYWIKEGHRHGVTTIGFSGGEVLLYPYLLDAIQAAHTDHCAAILSTSGYGLTQEKYFSLVEAGIDGIHISLNGSTEELNLHSRNGYAYAREAIKLLYFNHYPASAINFVLTKDNARDLPDMIKLAETFHVGCLSVLSLKPDSSKSISLRPSAQQMVDCAKIIDQYSGKLNIQIECCYSELIGLLKTARRQKEYQNKFSRMCRAGIHSISVDVNGRLHPCRHISLPESWESIQDYLTKSIIIQKLHSLAEEIPNGCSDCLHSDLCRPCLAIRLDTQGSFDGLQPCPFKQQGTL